jgi:hypothetical protein
MPARKKKSAAQLGKHGKRQAGSQALDDAADDAMAESALPAHPPAPALTSGGRTLSKSAHPNAVRCTGTLDNSSIGAAADGATAPALSPSPTQRQRRRRQASGVRHRGTLRQRRRPTRATALTTNRSRSATAAGAQTPSMCMHVHVHGMPLISPCAPCVCAAATSCKWG